MSVVVFMALIYREFLICEFICVLYYIHDVSALYDVLLDFVLFYVLLSQVLKYLQISCHYNIQFSMLLSLRIYNSLVSLRCKIALYLY